MCACVCVCGWSKIVSLDKILCSINTAIVITLNIRKKCLIIRISCTSFILFYLFCQTLYSLDSGISKDSSPCFCGISKDSDPVSAGLEMILAPVLWGFQRIPDPVSVGLEMIPNLVLIPNPVSRGFQKIPDPVQNQNQIYCSSIGLQENLLFGAQ